MQTDKLIQILNQLNGSDLVQLSAKTGVSLPTLYNWRSGRFEPKGALKNVVVNALKESNNELS